MKNRKTVRFIAILLAVIMAVSVIVATISSMTASAVTRKQIDDLKAKSKALGNKKSSIQSEINSLQYDQLSATAKKTVLDNRISLTEEEIDNITDQIAVYNDLIVEKEFEVKAAERAEESQLDLYKRRIRDMEENDAISYIAVLFDAADFADLLARIDFISDVMKSDEKTYEDLVEARLNTIAAKESLVATRDEQEIEKEAKKVKQLELEEQVAEATALLIQIEADLEVATALWQEMDAEIEKLQADINAKSAELRRQEEAAAAAGRPGTAVNGTGSLMWPGTSNVVTSLYGTRLHPVHKVYRTHYGIDLRAAYGSDIYAADSGKVITATYSSSYGNYVVLDHGSNGMTTLYAHLSKLNVKAGQAVNKGDVVGFAGSTGTSTATHLHFEVTVNGSRKNPLDYYSSGYVIKDGA